MIERNDAGAVMWFSKPERFPAKWKRFAVRKRDHAKESGACSDSNEAEYAPASAVATHRADNRPAGHLAAGAAMVIAVAASLLLVPGIPGVFGAGLAVIMIAIAAIDARRYIIPDTLTLAAFGLGLIYTAVLAGDGIAPEIADALLRGAIFGLTFLAVRIGYRQWRGRDGIGLGDVKLAAAAGIWLGWMTIPLVIEIAAAGALAVHFAGYVWRARAGGALRLDDKLPFGLWLAPATWLGWLIDSWSGQLPPL